MTAKRKMPWLRLYTELPFDPKIRRLRKAEHKWLYIVVLTFARSSPQPGVLLVSDREPVHVDDLADAADLTPKQVRDGLDRMEQLGLIELDLDADAYRVPSWGKRQFKSDDSTGRWRQWEQQKRGAARGKP